MRTIDTFILKLDKPLIDSITLAGGIEIYLAAQLNPEWNVASTAFVEVTPNNKLGIKKGDEVAISYKVVSKKRFITDGREFSPTLKGSDYLEHYVNNKGWTLTKMCMPSPTGAKVWIGLLKDNRNQWLDGSQGDQSTIERWMSQFSFGSQTKFVYSNFFEFNNSFYWRTEVEEIYAKKVGESIIALGDKIICEPIDIDLTEKYNLVNYDKPKLLPQTLQGTWLDRATVVSGGEKLGLMKGDIVGFQPKFCERYKLWGKEYLIIGNNFANCIWKD